jgi:hypothetical protein
MLKKTTSLLLLLAACSLPGYAQKDTKDPFTVVVSISPLQQEPEQPVKYRSEIETPLNPLTNEEIREVTAGKSESNKQNAIDNAKAAKLAAIAKEKLAISASKINPDFENPGWFVVLTTSDVTITSTNPKPIGELSNSDHLFKYTYNATLKVVDNDNNVVYKTDVGQSGKEQEMPKAVFFLNPAYKVRLGLVKNNPEKTKKIVDEMMENKNALILENIVDQAASALDNAYEQQTKTLNLSLFSAKGKAYEELNTTSEKIMDTYGKFRALSKKNRIPKENMDQVMRESILVWEKFIANNKELEEKAMKGLVLNCALASTWLGDHEKASQYLAKVPEATMPDTNMEEDDSTPPGTTMILSFDQSAQNAFYFNNLMKEYGERAVIAQ